jgi:endonuclease G, mitochondrial
MATIINRLNDTASRYRQRKEIRSRNIDMLSSKNYDEILKIEGEGRVKIRKDLLKSKHENISLERVIEGSDIMPINYLGIGIRKSDSVCRIEVKDRTGRTLEYGTGFMVTPSLLITNNHVLENSDLCKKSLAQFHYQDDENFVPKQIINFSLDPDKFFYTNPDLDFTVVSVKPKSIDGSTPLSNFGYIQLIAQTGKIMRGEYVSLIQHPNGEKKSIAIRENRLVDILPDFLHYVTDTQPGSSGCPVFNDQWDVVALHHSGVPDIDENGNYLSIDGTIWNEGMDEDKISWVANEGVRISKIIEDLKKNQNTLSTTSPELLTELIKNSSEFI